MGNLLVPRNGVVCLCLQNYGVRFGLSQTNAGNSPWNRSHAHRSCPVDGSQTRTVPSLQPTAVPGASESARRFVALFPSPLAGEGPRVRRWAGGPVPLPLTPALSPRESELDGGSAARSLRG